MSGWSPVGQRNPLTSGWRPTPPPPPPPPEPEAQDPLRALLGDRQALGGTGTLGSSRLGLPGLELLRGQPPAPTPSSETGLISEEAETALETARETTGDVSTVAVAPARIDQVRTGVSIVKEATSTNPTTATQVASNASPNVVAKAAGAPLSGLFALGGALQTIDGVEQLAEGQLGQGLTNTTGGLLSTGAGVLGIASKVPAAAAALEGTVFGGGLLRAGGATATAAAVKSGAASGIASGLGTVATKLGGGAVIVGGATQLITGDSTEDRALGGIKMAAGAAMVAGGPVGAVAGGLVLGAATIYEHRAAIGRGFKVAGEAIGDAAEAVTDKVSDVADKAKGVIDDITPW